VTASVDNINFFSPIEADKDIIISGYPTYSGNSSIEIQIDVLQ
jgi:acyl-CoA hydrolase